MNNRIDAIYARQSVDKKDSISIESQIEFCKYELKGGNCKEYTDKGYSGKNTDRPKFQELVRDIKRGLIAKVIVYKAGALPTAQHPVMKLGDPAGRILPNLCLNLQTGLLRPLWCFPALLRFLFETLLPCSFQTPLSSFGICVGLNSVY